jgi:predicted DNA-binding transcriptional regulator AlpA
LIEEKTKDISYKSSAAQYSSLTDPEGSARLFNNQIWRVKDVATFLGCSVGHIYNLASDEKIPKRKKGGLLFFVPDEVLSWTLEGGSYE